VSTELSNDRAWVEVDLASLVDNARAVRRAAHDAPLLPMVKANGYGLGVHAVVRALEEVEPWGFGVAALVEGRELRDAGIERPIVVFTPACPSQLDQFRAAGLRPVLDDPTVAGGWPADLPFHCEVDTGMGRAGVRWNDDAALAKMADHAPEGVFTHLHSADESPATVDTQLERFHGALEAFSPRPPLVHVCNSSGSWRVRERFDLARPGIFLYGGEAGPDLPKPARVASVRTRIASLRRLGSGDTVSYGAEWTAPGPTTVATLSIGYADGVPRAVKGRACALVGGRRCPVVGRVTMDMTMIDLGPDGAVGCAVGDIATVIGAAGEEEITLDEFAGWAGTISYEILVGLGTRLPRIYATP
jgi:alanine racemase